MRLLGSLAVFASLTATMTCAEVPTREQEVEVAVQACAGQATVKGLCWAQTPSQKAMVLEAQGFTSRLDSGTYVNTSGGIVTIEDDVMSFSCEVFDLCTRDSGEIIRSLFESYDVVDRAEHRDGTILWDTLGACGVLRSGEQVCYAVTIHHTSDRETAALLFKKGSLGNPVPSFH